MAKKKLTIAEEVIEQIFEHEKKPYHIIAVELVDGFCFHKIEWLHGIEKGEVATFKKRKFIIHEDLRNAFNKLSVHLAILDDAFHLSGIEIENADKYHGHDLAFNYSITKFEIQGKEENKGVILSGNKTLSWGGRAPVSIPKIAIDKGASYQWYNELAEAIRLIQSEVELYRQGKGTPTEPEEDQEDPNQLNMFNNDEPINTDDEFANAAV